MGSLIISYMPKHQPIWPVTFCGETTSRVLICFGMHTFSSSMSGNYQPYLQICKMFVMQHLFVIPPVLLEEMPTQDIMPY